MRKPILRKNKILIAYLLIIPAASLIFIFKIVPIFISFRYSFYNYNILLPMDKEIIGFANYLNAFSDPVFYNSLKVTFLFTVLKIIFQIIPCFFIALLLTKKIKGIGLLRSAILIPTVTSLVVVSIIWNFMYNPHNGLFNLLLTSIKLSSQPFLTSPKQALFSLLGMMIWKDTGFITILFLAGLQEIPDVFREAAIIDGANKFQMLFRVTIPLLKRTTLFVVMITTIWSFQVFTPIYISTKGGPMFSTNTLVYYIFERGFIYMDMGYAMSLSVILFFIIFGIGLIQRRFIRADFEY